MPERLWPKKKLGPSTIARAPSRVADDVVEELAGLEFEKRLAGRIDHRGIDAQLGEDFDFSLDPEERFGGGLRPEDPHRRRIEGEHHGRTADPLGHRPQTLHQPRMTEMHAVEVADRHGAAAKCCGKIVQTAEKLHGTGEWGLDKG